ncbi:MAG: hypothetical protein WA151_06175 [Desulfatirhabdiaceae bacterium]|jgi:hypothetical protein
MKEIKRIIDNMAPQQALAEISGVLKNLFSVLDEEARSEFLWDLMGESGGDKVSSLVHL